MAVLLISTYDLGRQPFGLASPAAWLREAGVEVTCVDLSREPLPDDAVRAAGIVAFFLPMHAATRLAVPVIDRVRTLNPQARVCAYGLYAPLNARLLREHGVAEILGGEFEEELLEISLAWSARLPPSPTLRRTAVALAEAGQPRVTDAGAALESRAPGIPRLAFRVPDRSGLPALSRYATLQVGAERRVTGYTEASRGCKHRCRHCPIVPIYDGRFRIVPVDVVIADIRAQVGAGARHITFGDPDFFNGIGHAAAVLEAFEREFPGNSYDVTIKVEHLLRHADLLPLLRRTGCAFVTSAVEAIDDNVLLKLEKGHTRADFERVVALCRDAGLALSPTFVAFTPWTTIENYCALLEMIDRLGLADHVAPIQLAIRLLVTEGSRLLELADIRRVIGPFDPRSLTYPWTHPDPRVDALQIRVTELVGGRLSAARRDVFERTWRLAHDLAGRSTRPAAAGVLPRAAVPYLNEPWYC
jgi:radical SAM superfamily enzyme YgiQ (UPF0313 family)